jgi:cytochrome oxidase Cu insertion factor (SCO1/SenC/PrrC family)
VGRVSLTAAAVFILVIAAPFGATVGGAKHPFDAMAVHRPAKPFAAPEFGFTSLDGREARLSALRGKVVVLGFFTTT